MSAKKFKIGCLSGGLFIFLMMGGLQIVGVFKADVAREINMPKVVLETGKSYVGKSVTKKIAGDKGVIEISELEVIEMLERRPFVGLLERNRSI